MKNLFKMFMVIALVAAVTAFSGCAMLTSIDASVEPHGIFSGNGGADQITQGLTEIASYSTILYLIDSGYDDYATKVKAARAAGKDVTTVTKWYYVLLKTTAYTK